MRKWSSIGRRIDWGLGFSAQVIADITERRILTIP